MNKKIKKEKIIPPFTTEIKEIIFGGLLGDFNLQTFSKGKTWRLRILGSDKFLPYIKHLDSLFNPWVKTKLKILLEKKHSVTNKTYKKCYFNTIVIPELKQFGEVFYELKFLESSKYPIHKKILPNKSFLLEFLSPRALAYWYMDDGSFKNDRNAAVLCTDNFSKTEVELLCEVLFLKFQIKTSIHKDGNNYRIYIPVSSFKTFKTIVAPYIIQEMLYKLGTPTGVPA